MVEFQDTSKAIEQFAERSPVAVRGMGTEV